VERILTVGQELAFPVAGSKDKKIYPYEGIMPFYAKPIGPDSMTGPLNNCKKNALNYLNH